MENELDLTREMAKRRIEAAEYREMQRDDYCEYCIKKYCRSNNCDFQGIKVLIEKKLTRGKYEIYCINSYRNRC